MMTTGNQPKETPSRRYFNWSLWLSFGQMASGTGISS